MFEDTFLHTAQLVTSSMSWGTPIAVLVIAATAIALLARELVPARRRRSARREAVLPVTSTSEAFEVAHSLLAATTCDVPRLVGVPASVDHDGIWRAVSQRPLAALVYTASQQREPMAWLEHTVSNLGVGEENDGWRVAVEAVATVDSRLCEWVQSAAAMERRQRASVAVVMRDAVAEYAAALR